MNLPNQITISRLFLAVIMFVVLSPIAAVDGSSKVSLMLDVSLVLFIVAAVTDILDGYLARKLKQMTAFGRISDPLVDKVLVIGTFIFLIKLSPELVAPWMVVVIMAREFLISSLRSYAESQGYPFPANIWGKLKTVFQCITIATVLLYLAHLRSFPWAFWSAAACVWITILITVLSGCTYLKQYKTIWQKES